ncbi:hypothetical protein L1987_71237 [Smallanthus sonchifolius]|uniref:Uncharacterized protein n=1 Tax=Smallanthus sonchifolius TaxID=185202 RepID=A0ACB9AW75_9ASTR|nr:hypothetical protein L1987_71237 [Smallanthus sonchifolius]
MTPPRPSYLRFVTSPSFLLQSIFFVLRVFIIPNFGSGFVRLACGFLLDHTCISVSSIGDSSFHLCIGVFNSVHSLGDLRQCLKEKGALNPTPAINFALDIAGGMAYLHTGPNVIIHRDLKSSMYDHSEAWHICTLSQMA